MYGSGRHCRGRAATSKEHPDVRFEDTKLAGLHSHNTLPKDGHNHRHPIHGAVTVHCHFLFNDELVMQFIINYGDLMKNYSYGHV
jgi:hypothetical protein